MFCASRLGVCVHHIPNLGQRSKCVFLALVSDCGGVLVDAFVGQGSEKFKGLAVCLKQYFDFPARWMTFCCVLLWVLDKIFVCLRNVFFALLFCYSFYFVWLSQPLGWFCLCNFDFVEWKYLLFSLHFDCNVLFFFTICLFGVFSILFNLKTLCLQSRMLNSYKWLKMKKVKVVICIMLLFILLSLCVCVFYWVI